MISQSGKCRVCDLHFSIDSLHTHELSCLQRSQDQTEATSPDNRNYESQTDEKNRKSSKTSDSLNDIKNESSNPVNSDEELTTSSENKTPSIADMPPYPSLSTGYSGSQRGGSSTSFRSSNYSERDTKNATSDPKQYGRNGKRNLFPRTKKYRYYPITCEYCSKRFQPGEIQAHQNKHHYKEIGLDSPQQRSVSTATCESYDDRQTTDRSKSVGGIPKHLRICYICGRLYGSMSIKIHEPKCLDKWRIQNDQLPPDRRAPEPEKPVSELTLAGSSASEYSVPGTEYNDPAVEAAFKSHLKSLIPCTHCKRTFSPDRILKHESCCIERPKPKSRECKTPVGGKVPS